MCIEHYLTVLATLLLLLYIYIYIYIYIYRQNKYGKPNDELPVEGSKKDTVLQCEFVDKCKAMNMKQTSNSSGFNMDVSALLRHRTLLIYR